MNAKDFIMRQPMRYTVARVCEQFGFQSLIVPRNGPRRWRKVYDYVDIKDPLGRPVALDVSMFFHVDADERSVCQVDIEHPATQDGISKRYVRESHAANWLEMKLRELERVIRDAGSTEGLTAIFRHRFGFK